MKACLSYLLWSGDLRAHGRPLPHGHDRVDEQLLWPLKHQQSKPNVKVSCQHLHSCKNSDDQPLQNATQQIITSSSGYLFLIKNPTVFFKTQWN